jgi:hypothetical protein
MEKNIRNKITRTAFGQANGGFSAGIGCEAALRGALPAQGWTKRGAAGTMGIRARGKGLLKRKLKKEKEV